MEVKTLLALLRVLSNLFFVTECVTVNETRHKRSEGCSYGAYEFTSNIDCCRCPPGLRLVAHCTANLTDSKCEVCEIGSYQDEANHESTCEPCKTCGNNDNMRITHQCTATSNTECQCEDGHYCDKGDDCRVCYACSTCGELEVKVPCNFTHDTQCKEKETVNKHALAAGIVIPLIIVVLLIVYFSWKNKKFCFKREAPDTPSDSLPILMDLDLERFLPQIAEVLGLKEVRRVVRRKGQVPEATIENIKVNNSGNAEEEAFQLLKSWYEAHGRDGAYRYLQQNLKDMKKKHLAKKVQEIVRPSNGVV